MGAVQQGCRLLLQARSFVGENLTNTVWTQTLYVAFVHSLMVIYSLSILIRLFFFLSPLLFVQKIQGVDPRCDTADAEIKAHSAGNPELY